jgi:predicted ATPase/class 3 adenylate cyclase
MQKTCALLLTDVVDSMTLSKQLGDAAMATLWAAHDRAARDLLVAHNGREIDKSDGFLLMFDSATDAVPYVVAYHRALASLDPPLLARAGLHVGEVILTENAPDVVARGAKPIEVDGFAKPTAARVMSLAAGGQTLLTDAARRALGPSSVRIASHGHWRMQGIDEPIELFEVGDADAPFTPPPDGAKGYRVVAQDDLWLPLNQVKHLLPTERDAFVGRKADLQDLAHRLQQKAALVSVVGTGGVGKTRLVIRYGWSWLGDYAGGVWFCDLSEARSVEGIAYAVAQGLEVPLGKGDPIVQLGHAIAGRGHCLVVLDNFEQVARHAAATLGRWLDRAREAQFVVTTREVLGLPGEQTLALASLAASEGAALFVARARSAKRDFEPDDVASIDALVQLLDGLPLAIELAAARVRTMSPETLLQRMGERFKLLASLGGRHSRQATLRATLDWSWELLSRDEQQALAQLSVFEGGFTLPAAEAVLALEKTWPTDAVQGLVDKSLVRRVSGDRFDLLLSVQDYAAEKLGGWGDPAREAAHVRHGAWFARFGTQDAIDSLHVRGGGVRRLSLGQDLDNVVVACGRAVAREEGAVASALLQAAWAILEIRGPFATARSLAERVLGLSALSPKEQAATWLVRGTASHSLGRIDDAQADFDTALAAAREVGDRRSEGAVLRRLGDLHHRQGRIDEARAQYEAARVVALHVGDRRGEGIAHNGLGSVLMSQNRMDEAGAQYGAALARMREVGDRSNEGVLHNNVGHVLREQGRMDEARVQFDAAVAAARESGNLVSQGLALGNLGTLHVEQGRMNEALADLEAALSIAKQVGNRRGAGVQHANIGCVLRLLGNHEMAIQHLAAALAAHREIGFSTGQAYDLAELALVEADAGRHEAALALAVEAVAVAPPFPVVHGKSLEALARVHLVRAEIAAAREAITRARALSTRRVATLAAVDALVAVAEGKRAAAEAALAEATADPAQCMPGSEVAQLVARARAAMDAADSPP